jgi:hypothetical protein
MLMMFKACQYATDDEKSYKDITHGQKNLKIKARMGKGLH